MTVGAMDLPPEGMLLGGVALAGDPARGTANTDGLSLLFTAAGITVQGQQAESERLLPWTGLDAATCRDQMPLPGGRTATVMVLTSGGQTIRFLLPPETVSPGQAAYLDQALPAWLARYRGNVVPTTTPAADLPSTPAAAAATGVAAGAVAGAARPPAPAAPTTPEPTAQPVVPAPDPVVAAAAAPPPTPPAPPAPTTTEVAPAPAPPVIAPSPPAAEVAPAPPAAATPVVAPVAPIVPGPPTAPTPPVGDVEAPPVVPAPGAPAVEPTIDPVTGAAIWADPLAAPPESGKPAKKSRKERKAEAAAAAAATAAAAAVAVAAAPEAPIPPASPEGFAPAPQEAPPVAAAPAPADQPDLLGFGQPAPAGAEPLSPLPTQGAEGAQGAEVAKKETNKRTLGLLIALLVVILAAGGLYLANRNSNSTTTSTTTATTATTGTTSPNVQDKALAASINLRLADLPAGWTVASGSSAANQAPSEASVATFASCLGLPTATVDQLFGEATQSDVSATAASPVFAAPADPTILMQSHTNVVQTAADVTADAAPYARPNFVTCYQTFQSSNAPAGAAGATAQVTQVSLAAPAGVSAYGYLTTFTIPGQGTKIVGDAFIFGGRIEATLSPSTSGEPVPSAAFSSAYSAMVARVAAHSAS